MFEYIFKLRRKERQKREGDISISAGEVKVGGRYS